MIFSRAAFAGCREQSLVAELWEQDVYDLMRFLRSK